MSKKFTAAQRSYRTFEHEALGVIEALMKWEDKLVGREFTIVTDEALETIKMSNRDGKSGRLIRWDEYLSRFQYEVMHVPGVLNKVADCLSRYYENDWYDEVHEPHNYVSADLRLDPNREDLTELRMQEITNVGRTPQVLARRLRDCNEDCVAEADQMAEAAQQHDIPEPAVEDEGGDLTVADALQDGPSLRVIVLGGETFIHAVREGYKGDNIFAKVIDNPGHYPIFRVMDGIIHTKNCLGDECMCVPQSLLEGKRSLPEIVIDHAHDTLGHLRAQKTSEYTR
jgi:hypothetical protein